MQIIYIYIRKFKKKTIFYTFYDSTFTYNSREDKIQIILCRIFVNGIY